MLVRPEGSSEGQEGAECVSHQGGFIWEELWSYMAGCPAVWEQALLDSFARVLAVLRESDNRKLITALHLGCIVLSPSKLIRHFTLHVKRRLNKDLWENPAHSSAKARLAQHFCSPAIPLLWF